MENVVMCEAELQIWYAAIFSAMLDVTLFVVIQ